MPDAPTSWTQMPPGPPARNPMEPHVKVIAIISIVFGSLAALGALILLFLFGAGSAVTGATTDVGWLPGFLAGLGILLALFIGLFAALDLTAGILLLKRRRAGKGFGIAAAIVSLANFPFGTAFGVYALVILSRRETDELLTA